MKKVRTWCDGGKTPVDESKIRGKMIRCPVCDQRFLPKTLRSADGRPMGLEVPPHKAY